MASEATWSRSCSRARVRSCSISALATAFSRPASSLAAVRAVREAEINPLIVKREGEGVVAVDGLVVLEEKETT